MISFRETWKRNPLTIHDGSKQIFDALSQEPYHIAVPALNLIRKQSNGRCAAEHHLSADGYDELIYY